MNFCAPQVLQRRRPCRLDFPHHASTAGSVRTGRATRSNSDLPRQPHRARSESTPSNKTGRAQELGPVSARWISWSRIPWIPHAAVPSEQREDSMGRRGYPPEFRQRVLDLVATGRGVKDVARDLGVSDQTIYSWRHQDRIVCEVHLDDPLSRPGAHPHPKSVPSLTQPPRAAWTDPLQPTTPPRL